MISSPVKRFLIQLTLTFVIFVDNTLATIEENEVQQILSPTEWCKSEFDNCSNVKEINTMVVDICINALKSKSATPKNYYFLKNDSKIASNNANATQKQETKQKAINGFICAMEEKNKTESAYKNAKEELTNAEQTKKKAKTDLKKAKVTSRKAKKLLSTPRKAKENAEKAEKKAGSAFRRAEYNKKTDEKPESRNKKRFKKFEKIFNKNRYAYKRFVGKIKYAHRVDNLKYSKIDKDANSIVPNSIYTDHWNCVFAKNYIDGRSYARALYLRYKDVETKIRAPSINETIFNYYITTVRNYEDAIKACKDAESAYDVAESDYNNAESAYKNAKNAYKNAKYQYKSIELPMKNAKKVYKNAEIIYETKKKEFISVCENEYSEFVNNKTSINK